MSNPDIQKGQSAQRLSLFLVIRRGTHLDCLPANLSVSLLPTPETDRRADRRDAHCVHRAWPPYPGAEC